MSEKYNVSAVGAFGNGGEYPVQEGFGWTNGVVLYYIDQYKDQLTPFASSQCQSKLAGYLLFFTTLFTLYV